MFGLRCRGDRPVGDTARRVRVLLDAFGARFGGTAYAVGQLAAEVAKDERVEKVLVVTRPGSIVHRATPRAPKIAVLAVRATLPGRAELFQRVVWEGAHLPALVAQHRVDGVLSFSGMLPVNPGCPVVSLLANPIAFEDRTSVGSVVRRAAIARTSRHAAASYVPSSYVARMVGRLPRVRVVPLGVNRDLFRPSDGRGTELLYVSDYYGHKRHELLLEAYARLKPPRPVLRLIGNPTVDQRRFRRLSVEARALPDVEVEASVSLQALLAAYSRARVFVIPSEHESFSMPVAEALCCGVPVVARDHPVFRETAGPGALYVTGDDPAAWAKAIEDVAYDDRIHARLRYEGLAHARRFSWSVMADRFVDDVAAAR